MKPGLIVCLFIVIGVSCRNSKTQVSSDTPSQKQAIQIKGLSVQALKRSLIDSVKRFGHLSEAVIRDDSYKYVFYVGEVNNIHIGIIAITDSVLYLFQKKDNGHWVQKDSITFTDYAHSIDIKNINSDNQEDLIVYGFPDVRGNRIPYVFISDSGGLLHYRSDIHLHNIDYIPNKNLVTTIYQWSCNENMKEYYQWHGDSLVLVRGAEQNNISPECIMTTFYRLKNGKRYDYKKVVDNTGAIYDTALWKQY